VIDEQHYACDENKRFMVDYWYQVCVDYPDNVKSIVTNDKTVGKIYDFFISISPSERYVRYNQYALPSFYSVILLCATQSPRFLQTWMNHTNFEWAVKYLYLETPDYSQVANVIYEILKTCCVAQPGGQAFRTKHIPLTIQYDKLFVNPYSVIRFFDLLLRTNEDAVIFCKHHGLEHLHRFIEHRVARDAYEPESAVSLIEDLLNVLYKATHWLVDDKLGDQFKVYQQHITQSWDNTARLSILSTIFNFLKRYPTRDRLSERCYKVLIDLALLDVAGLNSVIRFLHHQLSTSQQSAAMEVQYTYPKSENFYLFAHAIVEKGVHTTEPQISTVATDLALTLTAEVLNNSSMLGGYFSLVETIVDTPALAEMLRTSTNVHRLLLKVFIENVQVLDNPKAEETLKKLVALLRGHAFPLESIRTAVSIQMQEFDRVIVLIQKALSDNDETQAEQNIVSALNCIKALLVLLDDQSRREFVQKHQAQLAIASNIAKLDKFKTLPRANEVLVALEQLLKL